MYTQEVCACVCVGKILTTALMITTTAEAARTTTTTTTAAAAATTTENVTKSEEGSAALVQIFCLVLSVHRLVGLVVKASASGAEDPGFESRLRRDFSGSSHGTPVATLPGAWHYRVSAGTSRPGVNIL